MESERSYTGVRGTHGCAWDTRVCVGHPGVRGKPPWVHGVRFLRNSADLPLSHSVWPRPFLCILEYLVMYDSGYVYFEHLLLPWYKSVEPTNTESITTTRVCGARLTKLLSTNGARGLKKRFKWS